VPFQRHVKPPTWRTSDLERSNSRHKESPGSPRRLKRRKGTPVAEGGTMGEKLPKVANLHVTFVFFYMP